jgi:hypothetical protein
MSQFFRLLAALVPVALIAQFPVGEPEASSLPLLGSPRLEGGLEGFFIECLKPGCQLEVFLKTLNPSETKKPMLFGIDGGLFRNLYGPNLYANEVQLKRRMSSPTFKPLVLNVGLCRWDAAQFTIYEITIERWEGGVFLSTGAMPQPFPTPPLFVKVSPQSFADAARESARSGEINSTKRLLKAAALLYPEPDVVSRIHKAIDEGTSGAIANRLSRARQFRSVGDWQHYTTALSEALTVFPQSREMVEAILSEDIQGGRDLLRTGGGIQALQIVKWVRTALPDFAAAWALESEAKAQVVADALDRARISDSKGAFDQEQSVLVAALKVVPDDQQLQSTLASVQKQLEADDKKKMEDAEGAIERAATGRRAVDLAEALSACRVALDGKDYPASLERCGSLIGTYPQETAAKVLAARVRIEVPLRAYRNHAEAEQILALPETVPTSMVVGKVGNTVDWHGSVRLKTVDNYYVIDTSSGSFVVHQKAGVPFLRIGQPIAVIGKIQAWPTVGTLGGRPQIMPMLQPDRIDQ